MQEFAISKNIQLGDEKGLKFPSVWDWSLQFTAKDRTLFHNPLYVGRSMPRVQNGSVKPFKRTKVHDHLLLAHTPRNILFRTQASKSEAPSTNDTASAGFEHPVLFKGLDHSPLSLLGG